MKKIYLSPVTEAVKLNINDAVLDIGIENNSHDVSDDGLGKENNFIFGDDSWDNDLWGDGGNTTDPYDLWSNE
jgi:hypothetical protein